MNETKIKVRFYNVAQWKKEENFLSSQHKMGWKFIKTNAFCVYRFEKCEPNEYIYQLDYNPEGIKNKSEYIQMFNDCGWEYIQDACGYSYFRKEKSKMKGKEEIFCDDTSRLEMMKRVFKGKIFPLIVIFFCVIIPQIFIQGERHSRESDIFSKVFIAIGLLYIITLISFAIHFFKYYNSFDKKIK